MYNQYLSLLSEFVKFPSISTDVSYVSSVHDNANWLVNLFKKNGFEVDLVENYGNPIVLAKYIVNHNYKTVLIYGHYDVQPANISEGWYQDPFNLLVKDDKLIARGVVDNKGQILIHMVSIFELIRNKSLGYNVVFMIEGNEETGSVKLEDFIKDYKEKLKCDFVFFSDGELTMNHPVIETGFRGIVNVTLRIQTSAKDNHSGLYGGSIPNAALVLCEVLSKMYDENKVLKLNNLSNVLENVDKALVDDISRIPFDENQFKMNTGVKFRLNNNLNFYLQVGYLTSAEITTLNAGYQGDGYRNAIPGTAYAKINFRISPLHKADDVIQAFVNFLNDNLPHYCEFNLELSEAIEPIYININNKYAQKAKKLASEVYGKECYFKICGAIVPVAGIFQNVLNVPVVSLGLGNEDCNMHGVNENFRLDFVQNGLNLSSKFFLN